jgi:xanthine/uracil permease
MVQLAIVVFFGLFAIVEIYQSVKNVQLPMPVYLALGIVLAVVSNLATLHSIQEAEIVQLPTPTGLALPEETQVISSID